MAIGKIIYIWRIFWVLRGLMIFSKK